MVSTKLCLRSVTMMTMMLRMTKRVTDMMKMSIVMMMMMMNRHCQVMCDISSAWRA